MTAATASTWIGDTRHTANTTTAPTKISSGFSHAPRRSCGCSSSQPAAHMRPTALASTAASVRTAARLPRRDSKPAVSSTVTMAEGTEMASTAVSAPAPRRTIQATAAAKARMRGPGVTPPRLWASANSSSVTQARRTTSSRCSTAVMASPPPNVRLPARRKSAASARRGTLTRALPARRGRAAPA